MTRHFFITMGLTLAIFLVLSSMFYELVTICMVLDISILWSVPAMVSVNGLLVWRISKTRLLSFNR